VGIVPETDKSDDRVKLVRDVSRPISVLSVPVTSSSVRDLFERRKRRLRRVF